MANSLPPRTRGINFLLGGTLVAVCFIGYSVLSGQLDFGFGAPDVRIDGPSRSN
ncbi:MAG: hypothetical protein WBA67_05305 [Jannaschia sp.]